MGRAPVEEHLPGGIFLEAKSFIEGYLIQLGPENNSFGPKRLGLRHQELDGVGAYLEAAEVLADRHPPDVIGFRVLLKDPPRRDGIAVDIQNDVPA